MVSISFWSSKCEEDIAPERNETKNEEHDEDTEEVLNLLLSCLLGIGPPSAIIRAGDIVPREIERKERREDAKAHDKAPIIIASEKAATASSICIWLCFWALSLGPPWDIVLVRLLLRLLPISNRLG